MGVITKVVYLLPDSGTSYVPRLADYIQPVGTQATGIKEFTLHSYNMIVQAMETWQNRKEKCIYNLNSVFMGYPKVL